MKTFRERTLSNNMSVAGCNLMGVFAALCVLMLSFPAKAGSPASVKDSALLTQDAGTVSMAQPENGQRKTIQQARTLLVQKIRKTLEQRNAEAVFFKLFNGGASNPSVYWKARLAILANNPGTALDIAITPMSNEDLKGAYGAFARKGVNGQPAIYLNQYWLKQYANKSGVERVLAEEMGHAIDQYLNGHLETPGDEGEAFANSLLNLPVSHADASRMAAENDVEALLIDGKEIIVEEATIYFNNMYKGTGMYTLQDNAVTGIQPIAGSGFRFSSANPNDATFVKTGNNVNGFITYIDPNGVVQTLTGVISRQDKTGSTTTALQFLHATNPNNTTSAEVYWLIMPGQESGYTTGGTITTSSDPNYDRDMNTVLSNQSALPRLDVSSPSVSEGAGYAVFSITRTATPSNAYSFTPTLTAGTATAGADYTASLEYRNSATSNQWTSLPGSLTIAASITLTEIRVAISDDQTAESSEDFLLSTGTITGANILNNAGTYGTAVIQDNDNLTPVITQANVSKTYGDASFTLNPQSTNTNGGFSYAVTGTTGVLAWNATTSQFDILGAGTTQVTITQAASGSYTSGTQVVTVTVAKAPLTVTANNATRVYGAANPTFTATLTGFVYNQSLSTSGVTGSPVLNTTATTSSNAGDHAITAATGSLLSDNYSFTMASGTLTISKATLTATADAQSKTYDGQPFSGFTVTYTGFVNGETSSVLTGAPTFSGAATTATNAGTYAITPVVSGVSATNYNIVVATGSNGDLTINKAAMTLTAASITKSYDGQASTFTATYAGFVNSESQSVVSGTLSFSGSAVGAVNAGTYTITPVVSGLSATNYNIVAANGTLTINSVVVTVSANSQTKTYDGQPFTAFTASFAGFVNGESQSVISGSVTYSGAATSATGAGTYAIMPVVSGLSATNYTFVGAAGGTLTISKATLTATADAQSKTYDGQPFSGFTVTYTGFVNGEDNTVLSGTPTFSGTATTAVNAGTYTITPVVSGVSATNYNIVVAAGSNGNLTISATPLTISVDNKNKTNDGQLYTGGYTVSYTGFVNNENASVLTGTLSFGGAALTANTAGTFSITASGLTAANYTISFIPGTLTIGQGSLNIAGQPQHVALCQGAALSLSVTVANASAYQWYHNNVAIAGATAATFTKNNATVADAGTYHVVVTGATGYGNATSTAATVSVSQVVNAVISTASGSGAFCPGSTVVLSANAGAVSYQWYKNNVAIVGATSRTYTAVAEGNYTVTIDMGTACGSTTSATFTLAVDANGDCDGDGIANNLECAVQGSCPDTDNDGTEDFLDTDSDNDGIADQMEKGTTATPVDTDNDGTPDFRDLDSDNDGITDAIEKGATATPVDTDNDGTPDFRDLDSDNDGITDSQERGTGTLPVDTDGDGTPDFRDLDSDNDGITDAVEKGNGTTPADTDNDGTPDFRDLDSDNDAISDNLEKGTTATPVDTDGDGTPDFRELDSDNDGLSDNLEKGPGTNPIDTDNDGTPDFRDTDSDNDGITDAIEKGTGTVPADTDGDGTPDFRDLDSDNDGITDAVEKGTTATPRDTDGDGTPDFRDLDSDNDGIPDAVEKGPNATPRDTDGDGIPDFRDLDSDNDGIPDAVEKGNGPTPQDTDGDGTPDFRDLDSDNDGIADAVEKGNGTTPVDTDGDGIPDFRDLDSDNDGISDRVERGPGAQPADSDGDGIPDFRELDADNDGKADNEEGAGDCDNDGIPDFRDEQACEINILVPDVFTPNGDGHNEVIRPITPGIATFKSFRVFNRWGNPVFETKEAGKGWDGRLRGVLQPQDTYLWVAEGIDRNGQTIIRRGVLSLLR